MKRCVVKFKGDYCNIEADRIEREDAIVFAYNGSNLVGIFDLGFVDAIYMTTWQQKKSDKAEKGDANET